MPWQKSPDLLKTLALDFWIPWKLFAFPIVEWSAFVVSWSASSFLTVNLTTSQVFAAPPYNFSAQSVGFTNFAMLAGALLGLATNGRLSDWIAARATKKNRGIREPEMRIPTLIPYVLIMLLGNFVVAFGYQNHWDWKVSTIFKSSSSAPLNNLNASKQLLTLPLPPLGHRHHRLYLCWHSSCFNPCYRLDLCGRQLQASRRLHLRRHHGQQESLGIWVQQIHHAMVHCQWFRAARYDEHESDLPLVQFWDLVLLHG